MHHYGPVNMESMAIRWQLSRLKLQCEGQKLTLPRKTCSRGPQGPRVHAQFLAPLEEPLKTDRPVQERVLTVQVKMDKSLARHKRPSPLPKRS